MYDLGIKLVCMVGRGAGGLVFDLGIVNLWPVLTSFNLGPMFTLWTVNDSGISGLIDLEITDRTLDR